MEKTEPPIVIVVKKPGLGDRIPERLNPITTWKGFAQFLSQYGVIPLAIGVVIGTAVNQVVQAIVADLITPFISLFTPQGKLQDLTLTYHHAVFKVGAVLDSLITFVVIAFTVYFVAKILLNNEEILQKK